jgi:glycosyltransferase involved in cell wall biosynthesis
MKTLFILSIASGYGGAERSIEILLRHLPSNVQVRVYAQNELHLDRLRQPGALPARVQLVRVPGVQTLREGRLTALRLIFDAWRYRPDAWLINTYSSALVAAAVARVFPEVRRRATLYVRDFLWQDLDYIFDQLAGARVLTPSRVVFDRIGYLNPYFLKPVGRASSEVIPDMVEMSTGDVSYDGPVLHLATVNPFKGHADLMLALAELKKIGLQISVLSAGVVGDGALQQRLRQLAASLQLNDVYEWRSYVPDPEPLLRQCRAVVVPSVSHSGGPETFGRATIEAWSYRKPVIAYACGASAELIEHGIDGLLVPEGNTSALAQALAQLDADPVWARQLGEAGYAKAMQRFEASRVVERLVDFCLASN